MYHTVNLRTINIFWQVNQFVLDLVDKQFLLDLSEVAQQLEILNLELWQTYDSSYEYPETIYAFMYCVNVVANYQGSSSIIWDEQNITIFLTELSYYTHAIQAHHLRQINQEVHNCKTLYGYLVSLTQHYARLLFVRVDLGYLEEFKHLVTLEDFSHDLTKLLQYISNKQTCFSDLQGYTWVIEQGSDKGMHVHLLLIYDGQKHQNDYGLGLQVGEKWLRITQGYGCYYNCNTPEYKAQFVNEVTGFNKLGIGMIHRDNPTEVANAINAGLYLTKPEKTEQFCCIKLPNARTFGHGQYNVGWRRGIIS